MTVYGASEWELGWYYGAGTALLGGSSCMGPMLEHASTYYVPAEERRRVPASEVTAWPRLALARDSGGHVPDDGALHRYGRIGRKLRDAEKRMPKAPEILAAYWGESGDVWSRSRPGRLGALLRFTAAGAQLIAEQRKRQRGARSKLPDAAHLANGAVALSGQALLGQALTEANNLLQAALAAYANWEPRCAAAAE